MANIGLRASLLVWLVLAIAGASLAQDQARVSARGSAIVNAVLEELARASGSEAIGFDSVGTARGIDEFCAGEIKLATASRKLTAAEREICRANEITPSEFLIAHHIAAFISHVDAPAECLSFDAVQDALKPTASNVVADWSFYQDENADLPLNIVLPDVNELAYVIVDGELVGDGLRLDGRHYEDASEATTLVAESAGALALVPWTEALGTGDLVKLLESGGELGACALPSAEAVESESYPFALSMYVYLNRAGLDGAAGLTELMQFVVSEASAAIVESVGAVPPSSAVMELNARILADADAQAGVGGDPDDFRIPPVLSGEITIVGAANAHQAISRAGDGLGEQLNVAQNYAGMHAGISALCDGEADIATLDDKAEADSLAACATNGIATVPFLLGAQATVLISNAGDNFASCLTTDQINRIWRAESANIVARWADVAESLPDSPLTLFGLSTLDVGADVLLQTAGETIPPIRLDTERDFDPLYRAAAVGNVSGSLTYMSWQDYQTVLEAGQPNIQLVKVDGGFGCVEPSRATIEAGAYALSRTASMLVSEASLADVNVQSLMWQLLDDDNWAALQGDGFVSASSLELPIMRRELHRLFVDAESQYSVVAADAETETQPADAGEGDG